MPQLTSGISQTKRSHRTGWPLVGSQIPSYGWQLHQLNSIGEVALKSVLCVPSIVLWKLFRCLIYLMGKQWLCSLVRTLFSVLCSGLGECLCSPTASLACLILSIHYIFFSCLGIFCPFSLCCQVVLCCSSLTASVLVLHMV